jgi:hypothetical protein
MVSQSLHIVSLSLLRAWRNSSAAHYFRQTFSFTPLPVYSQKLTKLITNASDVGARSLSNHTLTVATDSYRACPYALLFAALAPLLPCTRLWLWSYSCRFFFAAFVFAALLLRSHELLLVEVSV